MVGVISTPSALLAPVPKSHPQLSFAGKSLLQFYQIHPKVPSTFPHFTFNERFRTPIVKASVGSAEFVVEPGTKVKFPSVVSVPGCSNSLVLLGTGYREKVFAIIGVKVYAAGLYVNPSITAQLNDWKGKSAAQILEDSSLVRTVFEAPSEKSLQIVLVRDVDGKTFWDALNDAISPRIKVPTSVDEFALSTFCNTFQGRPLKQGTFIFLTWVEPSKMLVSISSDGFPSNVNAKIESINVSSSLFNVFLGDAPVSPQLKVSVANGLAMSLK
ncbi:chalcone-flavanone isomerase family protein [Tasmannia lanceolata]|uniref:chalcone-flavanone isomerase family protein n=1 Tax=Tasmannia lanceolata TaxID=3420 RepID=UPI004062E45B